MRPLFSALIQGRRSHVGEVAGAQFQEVIKAALGYDQPSIHVEFAERERRIEHQPAFRCAIEKLHSQQGPLAIAERLDGAVGRLDFQAPLADKLRK